MHAVLDVAAVDGELAVLMVDVGDRLVPPGDAGAIADAIKRLVDDAGLARSIAETAYAESPRYSWDSRVQGLLALFEELA